MHVLVRKTDENILNVGGLALKTALYWNLAGFIGTLKRL